LGTLSVSDPEGACASITLEKKSGEEIIPNPIIMAWAGKDCRPTTKARYAQLAGAKALLLVSTSDQLENEHHRDFGNSKSRNHLLNF
jgi:hypothetical protein